MFDASEPQDHSPLSAGARGAVVLGLLVGIALGVIHITLGLSESLIVMVWALLGGGASLLVYYGLRGRFRFRAALAALLSRDELR